ncbi:hypothetical protein HB779_17470 [Phyllobacterium sp. 628]|uniref:hypothetical protein n=1 Tax=Phyllobacterium sp. 628 TaxID=2718938 RepID=UPI00166288FD|nr:hypothetical protein [Phyllobacterium sp. 628]QND53477.1 hypothetical protein HB779_17470 [Phyllobacterium sp. 628]
MSSAETTSLIDAAISRLVALRAKVKPGACYTVAVQADSFRQFEDYTKEAQDIVSDLTVGMCGLAAGWGDQPMTEHDRKRIRECIADGVDDALSNAAAWAESIESEYLEAAE